MSSNLQGLATLKVYGQDSLQLTLTKALRAMGVAKGDAVEVKWTKDECVITKGGRLP